MAFIKTFGTTSGAYSSDALWLPNNIRSSLFSWTASGSGTNEYYCRTAANANPGFVASPPTSNGVYINGSAATKGTVGSLASGQWGFGNTDTLGYSTVYVRLSGGGDPDAQIDNHIYFYQMPQTGENVRFAPDSASINSATGLDQSAVAINDFIVEKGYAGTIGSASLGYLLIDPDRFEFNGTAECWINITTAAISPRILGTASGVNGRRGLYLKGTAISVLDVMGGFVGVASRPGEASTATTVRVLGSDTDLQIGNGATVTNLHQYDGNAAVRCGVTTTILYGGTQTTEENGAMTTVTQKGGTYVWKSSGNITTYNIYGGTHDQIQSGAARTLGTLNKYRGSYTIKRNKEAVTTTTEVQQDTYSESISG
jgi:hypothetical protein